MATHEPTSAAAKLRTEEELRVILSLPNVHAIRSLRHKKKIPFVKLGYRTIRYDEQKVLAALDKLTVKEAGASK